MLVRLNTHRNPAPGARRAPMMRGPRPRLTALVVTIGAAGALLAAAANAPAVVASGAALAQPARPTPPAIQPTHGRPFIPVQGDWEGTANGFAASFNLILDAVHQRRAGVPQYAIQDLVMLRPLACPPDPAHYGESILDGRLPAVIGGHGSLGLSRFGLLGGFTGMRSATLDGRYVVSSCHGMLTWHMHPAVRRTVANGTWTIHYAGGEQSSFQVRAGGRLATAIRLPRAIASCNGLEGTLDVFIGTQGGSSITRSGVTLKLRFSNGSATGTLSAGGCKGGPLRVTAGHSRG